MRKTTILCYAILVGSFLLGLRDGPRSAFGDELPKASSSAAAKQSAINALPLHLLNEEARQKVMSVINHTSVYRRLPASQYFCDPDMHNFLIRYPEVIVGIWKLMGITRVDTRRIADYQLEATDGMGTNSSIELLYGTRDLHIYYGQGYYEGPLFHNKLRGSCLLVLRSEFGTDRTGEPVVVDYLDVFLRVDNIGVKILARTLHSLVGKTADMNFAESTKFIGKVSETAQINGRGVERLGEQIEDLRPEVREAFQKLALTVNDRAAERLQQQVRRAEEQPREAPVETAPLPPIRPLNAPNR